MKRHIAGIVFLFIIALPYLAMFWTDEDDADARRRNDEILSIVAPHSREIRQEYSRGFRDWMKKHHERDVHIRWLDVGGTSKMLKDLESRFSASPDGSIGVDLMFGGGIAPYYQAIEQGWLAKTDVSDSLLAGIPSSCAGSPVYDPNKYWYGVALSSFGIIYNRTLIERLDLPVPRTWEDLAKPEYFTWIASGDPRSSGSVHMCYEIILQSYGFEKGWALLTRISGNIRRFGETGGSAPREVAAGDVVAGMVIDQYAQRVIDAVGNDALGFVLPEGATIVGADAIALLKRAAAPDLGKLFIEYCLLAEGQRLLFQPAGVNGQRHSLYMMPVRKALYEGPHAPASRPHEYKGGLKYDEEKGGQRWRPLNDLLGAWFIDSHSDLTAAWQAVIRRGCDPDDVQKLCAVPVTEQELHRLAATWQDSRQRLAVINQWARDARKRYKSLIR